MFPCIYQVVCSSHGPWLWWRWVTARDARYSDHCDLSNVVAIDHSELLHSVAGNSILQHKECCGL